MAMGANCSRCSVPTSAERNSARASTADRLYCQARRPSRCFAGRRLFRLVQARALIAGGLTVLEITLRTAAATKAVTALAKTFPSALIGAFLPGAATASKALALRERGFQALKFFPAEPAGGQGISPLSRAPCPI